MRSGTQRRPIGGALGWPQPGQHVAVVQGELAQHPQVHVDPPTEVLHRQRGVQAADRRQAGVCQRRRHRCGRAGRQTRHRVATFGLGRQPAQQRGKELRGVDRLGHMVVHARGQAGGTVLAEGIGRHREDRCGRMGRLRADALRCFQAVHEWHLHVHQDQVVGVVQSQFDSDRTVVGERDFHADEAQQFDRHLLVHRVVLGQQHAGAGEPMAQRGLGVGNVQHRLRQGRRARLEPRGEPELAAHAGLARHADVAAHHGREVARDRQAQAGATVASRRRRVRLHERGKQGVDLVQRDADAGVVHAKSPLHPGRIGGQQLGANGDAAGRGELHRIAQQVQQSLGQPRGVAAQCVEGARYLDRQRKPLGPRPLGDQRHAGTDDRSEREVGVLQCHPAGLDLRQVEDVVDHLQQVVGGIADLAQPVGRDRVERIAPHQVGQPDDGVQRGADLVAHVGHKRALGPVRGLGDVAGDHQFRVGLLQAKFDLFELGDVGHQHQEAAHLVTDLVRHVRGDAEDGASVAAASLGTEVQHLTAQDGRQELHVRGQELGVDQVVKRDAVQFLLRLVEPFAVGAVCEPAVQRLVPVGQQARLVVGHRADEALALDEREVHLPQLPGALGDQLLQAVAVLIEFLADALVRRDVLANEQKVGDAAIGLADRSRLDELEISLPVLAHIAELADPGLTACQRVVHLRHPVGRCAPGLQFMPVAAQRFLAREAAHPHERVVDVVDPALGVRDHDARRALLDGQRQLAQLLLLGVAFGEVAERNDRGRQRASRRVEHRRRVDHHPPRATRRRDQADHGLAASFAVDQCAPQRVLLERHRQAGGADGFPVVQRAALAELGLLHAEEALRLQVAVGQAAARVDDDDAFAQHRHHRSVLGLALAHQRLRQVAFGDVGVDRDGATGADAQRGHRHFEPALPVRGVAGVLEAELLPSP